MPEDPDDPEEPLDPEDPLDPDEPLDPEAPTITIPIQGLVKVVTPEPPKYVNCVKKASVLFGGVATPSN